MTSSEPTIKRSTKPDFQVDRPDSIRVAVDLSTRPDDVWANLFERMARNRGAVKAVDVAIRVRDEPPTGHVVFMLVNAADLPAAIEELDSLIARVHEEWDANPHTVARRRAEDEKREVEEELTRLAARLDPPN